MYLHSKTYMLQSSYAVYTFLKIVILGGGTELPTVVNAVWFVTLHLLSPYSLIYTKKNYITFNKISIV